jgi:hypothetical protein
MYLNKSEKHWIEIIIKERLCKMNSNINKIENEEEKKDSFKRSLFEKENLLNVLYKLN